MKNQISTDHNPTLSDNPPSSLEIFCTKCIPGCSDKTYDFIALPTSGDEARRIAWLIMWSQVPDRKAENLRRFLVEGFKGATLNDSDSESMKDSPLLFYYYKKTGGYDLMVARKDSGGSDSEQIASLILYPAAFGLNDQVFDKMVHSVLGYACGKMQAVEGKRSVTSFIKHTWQETLPKLLGRKPKCGDRASLTDQTEHASHKKRLES